MAVLASTLRAIVRNEAIKNDPDEVYGWAVLAPVFASCFGGMVFGWDTGAISGVLAMDGTKQKFGYADWSDSAISMMEQNIVSTLQAGCFFACFFTGWLTDRYGRRSSLIGTGTLTVIGILFQACSAINGTIAVMYVGRFLAGMGVGAASTLTPLYISECAPAAIRGALTTFYQLFNVTGIMLSFWVNYGALLHTSGATSYVMPLALQSLPAVLLVLGMLFSSESPRWCARQDDWERATSIIVKLRSLPAESEYVRSEINEMAEQLEHERRLTGDTSAKALFKEMVAIPGNRNRAIISVMLMVCQQMTGVNAINYYAPQIFENLGMTGTETDLFATGVYGIVKFVSSAIFLAFLADSLGRRRSLLWTSIGQGIVMYIVGSYGRVQPPVEGQPVSAFGYVAIACIYIWAALFQFGWGPACWILVSEIPTARLRAQNVALGAATQWLFNFIVARTVLTMQDTMGEAGYGMFFMFGSFDLLMFIFVWFFIPETKGITLEKMDELFGVVDYSKALEDPETRAESIREDGAVSIREDGRKSR